MLMLELFPLLLPTATSSLPSPLKSAVASPEGTRKEAFSVDVPNAAEEVGKVASNETMFEAPPPGPGLTTVTEAVFGVATSEAGMAAVSRDLLTKVVVRELPFHFTVAPCTKPVPLTVS